MKFGDPMLDPLLAAVRALAEAEGLTVRDLGVYALNLALAQYGREPTVSNPRSTAIYAHIQYDPSKMAANRVGKQIASALKGEHRKPRAKRAA